MQNFQKQDFAYNQGWRDLQVLTLTKDERKKSRMGMIYLNISCPECESRMCVAQAETFCPRCGYTPELI